MRHKIAHIHPIPTALRNSCILISPKILILKRTHFIFIEIVCITNCTKPKKKKLSTLRFLASLGKTLFQWDGGRRILSFLPKVGI